ncbi:OmpH family outer membrane protein [Maridesulfovibrio hydrothermalis]|uniref:Outer membrane chaperone Skp (OmpH) n=1 Tax=Maridesulfovibrio hydrothermalis AM13 = DSM 14728 TaxID=1121451 RepID=L0R5U6_9BACT|nr:OmpH family outer membrane protein [Maridesulfovibrio hydrothermalis]CCO22039.1 Outer membrane chaperone Skp (OmpH) [Maridesulfovibrio hydrothermalis AM13 = DSM 14728]
MRKILFAALVLMIAFQAQAFAASPQKYAVVNSNLLLKDSEIGQAALKTLEKKVATATAKIKAKKKEIEDLNKALQKQKLVLSLEAKQDKELELKRKYRDYQDLAQATQRKIQVEEQKVRVPVIEMISKIVQEYGKKNGYAVIFDKAATGFIYVNDAVDVTNEIMLEMNRAYRAGKK